MKTNFLHKTFTSLTIIVLAITGAFVITSMADHKLLLNVMGYRYVSVDNPCHATKICSTLGGPICKYGVLQLWGKANETDLLCTTVVYERP